MSERIILLFIGCCVGFVLGYLVKTVRCIQQNVEGMTNVNTINDNSTNRTGSNDSGIIRRPLLYDIVLFGIIAITVWAAITSQSASNKVQNTQDEQSITQAQLAKITDCNKEYLKQTVSALNERSTYTLQATQANVVLQNTAARFFTLVLKEPPLTNAEGRKAVQDYLDALNEFVTLSGKTAQKVAENPFPEDADLEACYTKK